MKTDDPNKQLSAALGRIPSGLFIVTVERDGHATGMLASWLQQCSFQPPMVSLAMQRERPFSALLQRGAALTVNILEAAQTDMIAHFGKGFAPDDDAFQGVDVQRAPGRGPVLTEALAYLECRVVDRFPAGDHELLVAEVVAGTVLDEGRPMVHVRKNGTHY